MNVILRTCDQGLLRNDFVAHSSILESLQLTSPSYFKPLTSFEQLRNFLMYPTLTSWNLPELDVLQADCQCAHAVRPLPTCLQDGPLCVSLAPSTVRLTSAPTTGQPVVPKQMAMRTLLLGISTH